MDALLDLLRAAGAAPLQPLAYWVRELTPGWPPAFHAHPAQPERMVELPVRDIEIAGALILVAIVGLVGIVLVGGRRRGRRPGRR